MTDLPTQRVAPHATHSQPAVFYQEISSCSPIAYASLVFRRTQEQSCQHPVGHILPTPDLEKRHRSTAQLHRHLWYHSEERDLEAPALLIHGVREKSSGFVALQLRPWVGDLTPVSWDAASSIRRGTLRGDEEEKLEISWPCTDECFIIKA